MRLIDADALKADYGMAEECEDCAMNTRRCQYEQIYTKMDFCEWIDSMPTIERKTGKWIRISIDKYTHHAQAWYRCSVCGAEFIGEFNYCGHCGTDMRGDNHV